MFRQLIHFIGGVSRKSDDGCGDGKTTQSSSRDLSEIAIQTLWITGHGSDRCNSCPWRQVSAPQDKDIPFLKRAMLDEELFRSSLH